MSIGKRFASVIFLTAIGCTAPALLATVQGGAREEGRLLLATEVLQEIQGMPDQRVPDALLARAYGIAVIPDVTKVAFIFGGRHGNGVMSVRDNLNAPWSNPVCVSITGGSWGLQVGAQMTDLILVFTTRKGVQGVAGGKLTLGADASVAAGPYGRQTSAATDIVFSAEIYTYARNRGLFGGIALDGTVLAIDTSGNASLYHKPGIQASDILLDRGPPPPEAGERFLARLTESTHTLARAAAPSAAPATAPATSAAAQTPASPAAAAAEPPRTYPLETPK